MERLRQALQRLDWPVDRLSDQQITDELCRRWLEADASSAPFGIESGAHAAQGIFARMAREGNLDALCWEEKNAGEGTAPRVPQSGGGGAQAPSGAVPTFRCSATRGERKPPGTHGALDWQTVDSGLNASGWLVQCADVGLAFVAQTLRVPPLGAIILPTIRARSGKRCPLGNATIVYTESLNEELSLVCAELGQPWMVSG